MPFHEVAQVATSYSDGAGDDRCDHGTVGGQLVAGHALHDFGVRSEIKEIHELLVKLPQVGLASSVVDEGGDHGGQAMVCVGVPPPEALDDDVGVLYQGYLEESTSSCSGDALELSNFVPVREELRHDHVVAARQMCPDHRVSDRTYQLPGAFEVVRPTADHGSQYVDVGEQRAWVLVGVALGNG